MEFATLFLWDSLVSVMQFYSLPQIGGQKFYKLDIR